MSCAKMEARICDYVDGTLSSDERRRLEEHLAGCEACAGLARDAAAGLAFLSAARDVEPPQELLTRILFHTGRGAEIESQSVPGGSRKGWFRGWFDLILQPRFAMGMAMTILSFSMVGRVLGIQPRQLTMDDLDPARIWLSIDTRLHRGYDRALKYYDNLRLVYEIRSRLREWSTQEEEDRRSNAPLVEPVQPAGSGVAGKGKQ